MVERLLGLSVPGSSVDDAAGFAPEVVVRVGLRALEFLCKLREPVSRVHTSRSTTLIPTRRARLVVIMSERQPCPYDDIARKWHALAERRRAHLAELRDSGRWRRYYSWEQIREAVREAVEVRDTWARLAGLPEGEAPNPTGGAVASEAPDDWLDAELIRKAS